MQSVSGTTFEDYLCIIKNFMLEMHQRINEECQYPGIESHFLTIIDQAAVKLKTNKEQIHVLEKQLKELQTFKFQVHQLKNDHLHFDKRITQKCDQITILRETVKTLYADNQRICQEKQNATKELASSKENLHSIKKKIKRQDQEMNNHKNQLKKLTNLAEDRMNQYLKEDQQKQQIIKRQNSELQKMKAELNKKDKTISSLTKKLDQLKNVNHEYQNSLVLIETLKYQNEIFKTQLQGLKEKYYEEKARIFQENGTLLKQIDQLNESVSKGIVENKEIRLNLQNQSEKCKSYEGQIIMRTQKLKERNKQIKIYNEEIAKLVKRVEELSQMSDEVMNENKQLTDKCKCLEERLEELRSFQAYVSKIKGDIHQKKSFELAKLIQKIQTFHA